MAFIKGRVAGSRKYGSNRCKPAVVRCKLMRLRSAFSINFRSNRELSTVLIAPHLRALERSDCHSSILYINSSGELSTTFHLYSISPHSHVVYPVNRVPYITIQRRAHNLTPTRRHHGRGKLNTCRSLYASLRISAHEWYAILTAAVKLLSGRV